MATGKLDMIWLKRGKRAPMDMKTSATIQERHGLIGNANIGGKRQITIIHKEVWDTLKHTLSDEVEPVMRRANLMVSGVPLAGTRGKTLQIGSCRIRINGETLPCERMDQAFSGLRDALKPDWGGGIYGEALNDGEIRVGDEVKWLED